MNCKLTIGERLQDLRKERKLTLEDLATATGLSKSSLGSYEQDEDKDISHRAIITLANFYGVATDYLLGFTENKTLAHTPIEDLHLNDEMIELLKTKKLNHRLLCELVLHPNFRKLLMDLEIYVDGYTSNQIRTLNENLHIARKTVLEKYPDAKDDIFMTALSAAVIDENKYFFDILCEDFSHIASDIRKEHISDNTSIPANTIADDFEREFQEISQLEGSESEKQAAFVCYQLGINYHNLSKVEFLQLANILKKSKLLKSGIPQRGKKGKKQ